MNKKQDSGEVTKEEFKKMFHTIIQKEEWYDRFMEQLKESDEVFVKKMTDGLSEEEKDRYFKEFPEYEKYR